MTQINLNNSATTPEERKRGFMVLFISLICIGMGKTVMFSILPAMGAEMGLSVLQVTAIFATNAGAWVIFSPIWGRKSDFWGRRPVILIGFFGYAASLVALAFVTDMGLSKTWPLYVVYPLMVLARLIFGVVGSGSVPAAQAYVTDRTSREERAGGLARLAGAFGFGSMIGPALGGIVAIYMGFLAPIYFVAGMAFLSGILIWYYLPERTGPSESKKIEKVSFMLPEVLPFVLGSAVIGVGMAVSQQLIVYYSIDVFGMNKEQATANGGIGLMISSFMTLFMQLVIIPRLNVSPGIILKGGVLFIVIAFAVMAAAQDLYIMLIAMGLYGIGFGFAMPSASAAVSLSVGVDKQGATAGLISSGHSVGNIIGALAAGLIYSYSTSGAYIFAFVLSAAFLIYAVLNPRINVTVQQPPLPVKG
ncbi:MAG: MFS transporter [Methyloligellaceae bacterium]